MKVSLYVIGTEITRGIISDTHISFLSKSLSKMGFEVRRAVIVPDDGSLETELSVCLKDSNVVLVTGGLGPTSDDLTRKIIAEQADQPLVKNEQAWKTLYDRIGERIYGANESQTFIPEGFDLIPNPLGTAPGFRGKIGETSVFCMPGPPVELQNMYIKEVEPLLASLIGYSDRLNSERDEYTVFLIAEAKLEDVCKRCAVQGVSWGTRFQMFCVSLYVSGPVKQDRLEFIRRIRETVGEDLIADGDGVNASDLLIKTLKEKNLYASTVESCTSGLVAKLLTDKSGSSSWFWGGAVTYDNSAKKCLVNVKEETLQKYGAVSKKTAEEMALGILSYSQKPDFMVSISVTGIAGPTGATETKSVGTVCFGFALSEKNKVIKTSSVCLSFSVNSVNSRETCRRRFAVASLLLCNFFLNGKDINKLSSSWKYI